MKLKKNKLEASTGREDTGETEIRTTEKLDKTKSQFFETINICKPLVRMTKKREDLDHQQLE